LVLLNIPQPELNGADARIDGRRSLDPPPNTTAHYFR
jgi:hypothetical protein